MTPGRTVVREKKQAEQEKQAQNEIQLTKILLDQPAPVVSAQSWVVFDLKQEKMIFGKMERDR